MHQSGDLAMIVLWGSYSASIDWALWSTPRGGDSAFMQGLRPVFICKHSLFQPRVGNDASFSFWEVDRFGHGLFRVCNPRLHALALDPGAMVRTVGTLAGSPPCPAPSRTSDTQTSLPCTQLLSHVSCRRGIQTPGCGAADFLRPRSIPSHSRIGQHFIIAYTPQMLPSPLEVPNSIEDQTVRMVAPASQTIDAIPPAEVLPGRIGGVSFVCRSYRRLLPSFLQVSIRTDGMAGYTYEWSGHVLSRLLLAIHQLGAMSTCVEMAIHLRHFVVDLASPE